MAGESKRKEYLWAITVLVFLFFWWPRTVRMLIIDLVVLALCVFLAIRAKRES